MIRFADQLNAALKGADMSQSELARRVGVPRCSVSDWCLGRHQPRQAQVDRINKILDTELSLTRITSAFVAKGLGMCVRKLHEAMRLGTTDVGFVTPSKTGKQLCYRFYPKIVEEKIGL